MKKFKIGQTINATEVCFDIGLEHLVEQKVFDLPVGTRGEKLTGSFTDENETNYEFESVGSYEVVENDRGNLYKTRIDPETLKLKITDFYQI